MQKEALLSFDHFEVHLEKIRIQSVNIVICKSVVSEEKELISNWPIKNKKACDYVSFLESDWPI